MEEDEAAFGVLREKISEAQLTQAFIRQADV